MASNELTGKQEKFCQEYLLSGNISDAYRKSYEVKNMKPETVNRNAFALFHSNKISTRIRKLQEKMQHTSEIKRERILYELDAILNAKISDYLTIIGGKIELKDFKDLTDAQLRAVESIKDTKYGIEFKLHGKSWSTKRICEMLGYEQPKRLDLTSDNKQIQPVNFNVTSENSKELVNKLLNGDKPD